MNYQQQEQYFIKPLKKLFSSSLKFFKVNRVCDAVENQIVDKENPVVNNESQKNFQKNISEKESGSVAKDAKKTKKEKKGAAVPRNFTVSEDLALIREVELRPAIWNYTLPIQQRTDSLKISSWNEIYEKMRGKLNMNCHCKFGTIW